MLLNERTTYRACERLSPQYKDNAALVLIAYHHNMHGGQRGGQCCVKALYALVAESSRTGSVGGAPRSGRPKRSKDTVLEIGVALAASSLTAIHGESSVRSVSKCTGIAETTNWRVARKEWKQKPYRVMEAQELLPRDYPTYYNFAATFLAHVQFNDTYIDKKIAVRRSQLYTAWSGQQPKLMHLEHVKSNPCQSLVGTLLHDVKLMIWCGLTGQFTLEPFFSKRMWMATSDRWRSIVNVTTPRQNFRDTVVATAWRIGRCDFHAEWSATTRSGDRSTVAAQHVSKWSHTSFAADSRVNGVHVLDTTILLVVGLFESLGIPSSSSWSGAGEKRDMAWNGSHITGYASDGCAIHRWLYAVCLG